MSSNDYIYPVSSDYYDFLDTLKPYIHPHPHPYQPFTHVIRSKEIGLYCHGKRIVIRYYVYKTKQSLTMMDNDQTQSTEMNIPILDWCD